MPEQRLGRYTLGDQIGEGGMGVVFRARVDGAEGFSNVVAIKMLHDVFARDPGIRDTLLVEARTAQRLRHGNIAQLIDVGIESDRPFLVIEHVDGVSLSELLRARKGTGLPIADALYIAESVASALAYAHGLTDQAGRPDGVVHRDITPRNILLSRDGLVKLVDFGLAKALSAPSYTLPGTLKGTLGYLPPEQTRGESVDARADQFSMGIVLHEMLAGANPIAARDAESYVEMLRACVPAPRVGPVIDATLSGIVARATALEPAARYPTMDELRAELEAWRVERKIRTSGESLRGTMRLLLGEDATIPRPRPLADALGLVTPTADTKPGRPASIGRRSWRRSAVFAAIAVGGLLALALIVGSIAGVGSDVPADVAIAQVADANNNTADGSARPIASPDAAPIAVAATADAAAAVTQVDAGSPKIPAVVRQPGRLRVNVVPWANVYLDDRPLGGVPINTSVPAGAHRLTLHNPDSGKRVVKPIRIEPGRELEVTSW